MMTPCDPRLIFVLKSLSHAASATVILVGCLVLAGWMFDLPPLKSVLPGLVTMKANTALCFVLAGVSLWLWQEEQSDSLKRRMGQLCALTVTLVGLLTLSEYLFGWDLGIDQLLFEESPGAVSTSQPGRMAPNTALNFLLLGSALLLLDVENCRGHRPAQVLALTASFVSFLALTGYIYGVTSFYGISSYTRMALHTAVAFTVLCVGLLFARPDRGLMTIITSNSAGGFLARRLLPAALGLPLLLGWFRLLGQRAGLYSTEFGLSFVVASNIVIFTVLICWNGGLLHRADIERKKREEALHVSERRLADALDIAEAAVISVDEAQCIRLFDQRAERLFTYTAHEVLGKPLDVLIPLRLAEAHRLHISNFAALPETTRRMGERREVLGRRKDGTEFPAEAAISKLSQNGKIIFTAVLRDITERKRTEETLKNYAAQLEAANRDLEAFSYSVSHDLRVPLRGIAGFSRALLEDYNGKLDARGRDYLQRVDAASQRMGHLIDDLLHLSRVTRSEMRRERVDLTALARAIGEDLQKEQSGRGAEFLIQEGLAADGDPQLLRVVLENLLGNAWKFTSRHPQATIEVGVMPHNGTPAYFVRDDGAGFEMAYAGKLFGAFQRLHGVSEFEGTGIGLATVQRIVNRHGGRVWAEGAVEKGATFYFTLSPLLSQKGGT